MAATLAAVAACAAPYTAHASTADSKPKHSPRYLVATQLNRGLAGTPMAGTGFALEAAGWRYHVSPYLMAAIAGVESSYGRLACTQNRYWIFGLGSCGRSWAPPRFTAWRQAYDYFARFLWARWLSRGVSSPTSIGYTYCPLCGSRWGDAVEWHMSRFDGPMSARYR